MPPVESNNIGEQLHANGWQTGSVLTQDHATSLARFLQRCAEEPHILADHDRLIVVSQTCDIVAGKLEAEPYVEVLLAQECRAIDRTKANLLSTRFLSFRTKPGGIVLEAHATNRFWIPREQFRKHHPDPERSLDANATRRLCEWLGLRYTRPAWPAELVRRLPNREQLENILLEVAESVAEIRVAIIDVHLELPAETPYQLTVYAVVDTEVYQSNAAAREKCTAAFFRLLDLLRRNPGIVVHEDSEVLPGNVFTWEMMRMTDLWNLANLTVVAEGR